MDFYYAFKLSSISFLQYLILCTGDNGIIIISNTQQALYYTVKILFERISLHRLLVINLETVLDGHSINSLFKKSLCAMLKASL